MNLIDVSRRIAPDVAVYEGDDPIEHPPICDIGADSPCRITALKGWSTHTLTHVDAPRHFLADGVTLDSLPLTRFMGETFVVEVSGSAIEVTDIPANIAGLNVLFKTRNSSLDERSFHVDYVAVTPAAATELANKRVNLVGVDYLSVDRHGDEDYPAHKILLAADVIILEGLDLSHARIGKCELIALPLKIQNGDGSPTRAVLQYGE